MNIQLTKKQEQILIFLQDFSSQYHRPPTFREICTEFKFKSINSVTDHLRALEHKGFISRQSNVARGIEFKGYKTPGEIPILGQIAAGAPVLAPENIEGTISFSSILDADFALKVHGESMINAGILHGDTVLVKMQPAAEHRDIVVAMLDGGETTVKRLIKTNEIILRPENDSMNDISIEGEIHIIGKVVGVLRKY